MVLEKTLESPLDCKEIQPVHSEGDQPWDFLGKNDAKAETPVLWPPHATSWLKRLWCWEGLGAGGEGDDRGWDDWMASLTRWTWVSVNSRSWWWTGRPGVLRFMGSQSRTRMSDWSDLIWWPKAFFKPSFMMEPYPNQFSHGWTSQVLNHTSGSPLVCKGCTSEDLGLISRPSKHTNSVPAFCKPSKWHMLFLNTRTWFSIF